MKDNDLALIWLSKEIEQVDQAQNDEENREAARAIDLAFNMLRHQLRRKKNNWTGFNQCLSRREDREITKVGYMPKIQTPAHEMDTLVVKDACT